MRKMFVAQHSAAPADYSNIKASASHTRFCASKHYASQISRITTTNANSGLPKRMRSHLGLAEKSKGSVDRYKRNV